MEFKDATMATRTTCRPIPSPLPSPIPPESPRIPCYSRFGDSDQLYQNRILAITMIVLVLAGTVGMSFFLFTILKILENYCSRRIYLRRRHPRILFDVPGDSGFSDGDRAATDYPVFIDTVGLQQSVIDSIPVFNYRKDEGLIEGTECSVCLSEFQEDESLKLWPKCSHAFHIPCIDAWLISHKNCPLCRAPIVQDTGGTERSVIVANLNVSGQDEETRIENLDGESSREDDSGIFPNEDGDVTEASEANSSNHDVMRLHSPIVKDMAIQPVRRSASVDSCSASMNPALVDLDCDVESSVTPLDDRRNSCGKSIAISKQGSGSSSATYKLASIGRAIQKRPISLKSSSSHGRKFQFSRHSRSQSSTLPL